MLPILDTRGHATHVAGLVATRGVKADHRDGGTPSLVPALLAGTTGGSQGLRTVAAPVPGSGPIVGYPAPRPRKGAIMTANRHRRRIPALGQGPGQRKQ